MGMPSRDGMRCGRRRTRRSRSSLPIGRSFMTHAVLTMITINRESNDMLYQISKSIVDATGWADSGRRTGSQEAVND